MSVREMPLGQGVNVLGLLLGQFFEAFVVNFAGVFAGKPIGIVLVTLAELAVPSQGAAAANDGGNGQEWDEWKHRKLLWKRKESDLPSTAKAAFNEPAVNAYEQLGGTNAKLEFLGNAVIQTGIAPVAP